MKSTGSGVTWNLALTFWVVTFNVSVILFNENHDHIDPTELGGG